MGQLVSSGAPHATVPRAPGTPRGANDGRGVVRVVLAMGGLALLAGASLAYGLGGVDVPAKFAVSGAVTIVCAGLYMALLRILRRHWEEGEAGNRAVLETAADAIITIDGNGIVRSFNKSAVRIFGYGAAEVVGRNVKMLMPSPYREEHDEYLARYLSTGQKKIIGIGREVAARRKDGTVFPIELAVSEAHAGPLFTGIIRDVTERKELERMREDLIAELEEKNAELERFTYTVSHDLKSPLITISGFVGGLEQDARSGNFERLSADVGRISAAAERMKRLLDELLELSRVGRIVSPPTVVELRQVVLDVANDLSGPLRQRGVHFEASDDLPDVYGDRVRLREVVQNLVENAIKFMGDQQNPCIEVGVRNGTTPPVIFVRDNGIGVDPKYRDKIFGLFDKLNNDSPGTGIGLALAKRIVQLHGGRIWIESDGIGRGAEFCFTIPSVPSSNATIGESP